MSQIRQLEKRLKDSQKRMKLKLMLIKIQPSDAKPAVATAESQVIMRALVK